MGVLVWDTCVNSTQSPNVPLKRAPTNSSKMITMLSDTTKTQTGQMHDENANLWARTGTSQFSMPLGNTKESETSSQTTVSISMLSGLAILKRAEMQRQSLTRQ